MIDIDSLYTEVVLEYSKLDKFRKPLSEPKNGKRGVNPSCGDDIKLELKIKNGTIEDVAVLGSGCAISQASANIMAGLIRGKSIEKAEDLAKLFLAMTENGENKTEKIEKLEDAIIFQNIKTSAASRIKCATLGWHTLESVLAELRS